MSSKDIKFNSFSFSKSPIRSKFYNNSNSNNSNNSNSTNTVNWSNNNNHKPFFKPNNTNTILQKLTLKKKKNKSVTWKNNNKVHHINNNNNNHRKSIKVSKNYSNLTNEEKHIVKNMLSKNSNLTREEMKKLRKFIVDHLKTKSEKHGQYHLEPYEKNYLKFEATR